MKTESKKRPSRAILQRFVGISLRSKIDRMYVHLEKQHKSLLNLLDKISLEQYKIMSESGKYVKVRKKGVEETPQKGVGNTRLRNRLNKDAKVLKLKYALGDRLFLDTLKNIGKPALTSEVADRLRKANPDVIKKIATNKKKFMRAMYISAFNLSKHGQVKRTPVGKKSYEYSLNEWNSNKTHQRTA